ncbi:MAG TPA: hypothetical protein DEV87_05750 [Clostridiales bacterium]|nr:hypothetical protein [Clostridiales bacterium]
MDSVKTTCVSRPKKVDKKLLFYAICISIPVLHFLIFYVYINFNSFLLAFREYEFSAQGITYVNVAFKNFAAAWENITTYGVRIGNSILYLVINFGISTPIILLMSFYIYKNRLFGGFFKVMLFMPQILSAVVFGLIYKCITNDVYLVLFPDAEANLLFDLNKAKWAIILFNLIINLGVNMLMYTSAMSGVNKSIVESAEIDGCTAMKEFRYIMLPMIYPTILTLGIVTLARVFTDQYNLYTLYQNAAPSNVPSIGYFLYLQANQPADNALIGQEGYLSYPVLSAYGLILTAIVLPTTLFLRWLLNKYGPSAD